MTLRTLPQQGGLSKLANATAANVANHGSNGAATLTRAENPNAANDNAVLIKAEEGETLAWFARIEEYDPAVIDYLLTLVARALPLLHIFGVIKLRKPKR